MQFLYDNIMHPKNADGMANSADPDQTAAPPHGMYPWVSSYGMEADPPRFLYLKDECFLMTD